MWRIPRLGGFALESSGQCSRKEEPDHRDAYHDQVCSTFYAVCRCSHVEACLPTVPRAMYRLEMSWPLSFFRLL